MAKPPKTVEPKEAPDPARPVTPADVTNPPETKTPTVETPSDPLAGVPIESVETAAAHIAAEVPAPNPAVTGKIEDIKKETPKKPADKKHPGGRPEGATTGLKAQLEEKAFQDKCYQTGRASAQLTLMLCQMILGAEWAPDAPMETTSGQVVDEKEQLCDGWGQTYSHYGWDKTPGWVPMTVTSAAYVGKRLGRPQTASKWDGFKVKVGAWWKLRRNSKPQAVNQAETPKN